MRNIYVVRNKVACENVTDIFTLPNDVMACISFRSFILGGVKRATDKGLPAEKDTHFVLERLGSIDDDNMIEPAGFENKLERCIVACGLQEAEAIINSAED